MTKYGNSLDINHLDHGNRTPIMLAAEANQVETVKVFLKLGARLDCVDIRGRTVLHYAADIIPAVQVAQLIIEKARSIPDCLPKILNARELYLGSEQCFLVRGRDKGLFAYHYVMVDRGLLTIFKQVINRGHVDVGKYGTIFMSGWGLAPPKETVEIVADRFDPAKIMGDPKPDMTPLHYAIIRQSEELATLFIQEGADISIEDSFGLNAYHMAAMRGLKQVMILLETYGVDTDKKDGKNRTAINLAEENHHSRLASFLKADMYIRIIKRFSTIELPQIMESLEHKKLVDMKKSGQDVHGHIITNMREVESLVKDVLFEVGSSPVMQSSGAENNKCSELAT